MIGGPRPEWLASIIDAHAFAAEDWTEIGSTTSLGTIAGEWQTQAVTLPNPYAPDEPPIPQHEKVERPAKTMQLRVDLDATDAGQLKVLAAEHSTDPYAFRIVLPNGSERLFVALMMGADDHFDEANNAVGLIFSLLLQSNVVRL